MSWPERAVMVLIAMAFVYTMVKFLEDAVRDTFFVLFGVGR